MMIDDVEGEGKGKEEEREFKRENEPVSPKVQDKARKEEIKLISIRLIPPGGHHALHSRIHAMGVSSRQS